MYILTITIFSLLLPVRKTFSSKKKTNIQSKVSFSLSLISLFLRNTKFVLILLPIFFQNCFTKELNKNLKEEIKLLCMDDMIESVEKTK